MNTVTFRLSKHKPAQAIALAVLVLATNPSYATNYTFSDLGTITGPYAGTSAVANSINNLGQVTGYDNVNALVWNGDTATPLSNLPGGLTAYGQDINDAGQVAGVNYYGPAADLYHPIRWDGGAATQLDTWVLAITTPPLASIITGKSLAQVIQAPPSMQFVGKVPPSATLAPWAALPARPGKSTIPGKPLAIATPLEMPPRTPRSGMATPLPTSVPWEVPTALRKTSTMPDKSLAGACFRMKKPRMP